VVSFRIEEEQRLPPNGLTGCQTAAQTLTPCPSKQRSWSTDEHHRLYNIIQKVKEFRNRPGVAQRVPGGLGSQIS